MKLLQLLIMASRYYIRYFRRYLFLFIALSFGYGIITSITSLQAGMKERVYQSAKSHYAGDITLVGRVKDKLGLRISELEMVTNILGDSNLNISSTVLRTQVGNEGIIHFNGGSVRHKYTLGVDWANERDYFSRLKYSQGQYGDWDKENGIIISNPVAEELSINIGDSVLLEIRTKSGQINTGRFIVQAVVNDATIFGYYKCYIDIAVLNLLIGYDEDDASSIGIYLKEGVKLNQEAEKLQASLKEAGLDTAKLTSNRDQLLKEYDIFWKGTRYFVITLPVYLSEVAELLSAINIIAYFLYILMLLIIIVSVAVTFRLILNEREKEIGTLRGIGFHERDIISLLMMETLILFICSIVTGFLFAHLIIWIMGFFSFSMIPSFEIFMKDGRLVPAFSIRTTLINSLIVLFVLIPTVAIPVYNASRKPLSLVLTGGKDS